MIYLKNEEEIELLRENNLLVSRTLALVMEAMGMVWSAFIS